MISRRLLRIKSLQILYAHFLSPDSTINQSEKQLFQSINKFYDLYHLILLLLTEIHQYAEERIELAKQKFILTPQDINPNRRFTNNRLIRQLMINHDLERSVKNNKLSWFKYPDLVKGIYHQVIESDYYKVYLENEDSYSNDKEFVINILSNSVINFDLFNHTLEEESIFWTDDLEFAVNMVVKTIDFYKSHHNEDASLLPLFKNQDDEQFVKTLFRKTILNFKKHSELIHEFSKNWEIDRIAMMDQLIIQLAITEISEFPSIPVKVTLNEYIEIAKYYSTTKSSIFINGVLDKIIIKLKTENKIKKTGRGLLEK